MGAGGILLLVAAAVVFGLLVRELWRGLAPRVRQAQARGAAEVERRRREALVAAAPGGSPERPIEVASASVVEARATGDPCVICGKPVYVAEHAAETFGEDRLRTVRVTCRFCDHERTVYLRIAAPMVH